LRPDERGGETDPELQLLQKFAADYRAIVIEIGTTARELASAVNAVDMSSLNAAQARMEAAVAREDPLVDSANKFCQAR